MYVYVNWAIIWTNMSLLGTKFNEILIETETYSFRESAFENIIWKMEVILSVPQCVNSLRLSDAYMRQ